MIVFSMLFSLTTSLLIGLLGLVVFYAYRVTRNNIFRRIGIPGPPRIPLLGEMVNVMRKGLRTYETALIGKYGKVVGIYGGNVPSIILADLDLLRNVLIKDSHVFVNRRILEGTTGPFEHGLTVLKDENWKNARTIVSPTFSSAKLKMMYPLMDEVSDTYRDRLLEYADNHEIFNINALSGQYTLDTISSCLFGIETNSLRNENTTLIKHLTQFFKIDFKNIYLYIVLIAPRFAGYLAKRGYSIFPKKTIDYISNLLEHILSRRRQHLERRNDFIQIMVDHEEEMKMNDEKKEHIEKKDLNQQWGTLKKTLNDKEILGQGLVFLVAGYETTSVLLSFFFYVMATEPTIQEKVYEEILQEFDDGKIPYEKLNELQYLDMVIHETLRMYPPFIRFDRVASQDYQLGNYHIPKGLIINVPVYSIHHDPIYWPEPEKFIPERFSPDEKGKRHPMAFLPFGDGPRNCIGMRFALLEAKLAIAKVIRAVEFQRCGKTEVPLNLGKFTILKPSNGIWIRVVSRSE